MIQDLLTYLKSEAFDRRYTTQKIYFDNAINLYNAWSNDPTFRDDFWQYLKRLDLDFGYWDHYIRSAPEGSWKLDEEGMYRFVNPYFKKYGLAGYDIALEVLKGITEVMSTQTEEMKNFKKYIECLEKI